MGALLDYRPGVVTKGFRTLAHEQEQEDKWQLDQPEEDEVSCDLFTGLLGETSTFLDLPHSTSTSVCCNNNGDPYDSQSETLYKGVKDAIQGKDIHVGNTALPFSSLSPSSSSEVMNGHMELKELQGLQPATLDHMPGEGAS